MIKIFLKDICESPTNRDEGLNVSLKLLEEFDRQGLEDFKPAGVEYIDKGETFVYHSSDWILVVMDEDLIISISFVDELVTRLREKNMLRGFVFSLPNEVIYNKFQSVSTSRGVDIGAFWQNEMTVIKPGV